MSPVIITFALVSCLVALSSQDIYHPLEMFLGKNQREMNGGMAIGKYTPPTEMDSSFWFNKAQSSIKQKMNTKFNTNIAKNIIFFLGDGMSITTLTSARILKGQRKGNTGEEDTLSLESFPFSGLSKTYCANGQVADSACTSTAYLCGVKANLMTLGVNAHVNYNNCSASNDAANHVQSIVTWAQRAGKSTGIVTTTTVTHASPSGGYAHVANRMWESDNDVTTYGADSSTCSDIAQQLITKEPGKNFNVIMGGGRGKMLPSSVVDITGKKGERNDGRNLINLWKSNNPGGVYVSDRSSLLKTNVSQVDRLLGLFEHSYLNYHLLANETIQPTLAEMTEAAIKVVRKNKNGYFLFIEGGRIDHGHHATVASLALDEALELDKAIDLARNLTSTDDTLIVVSSDHAHTMTMAGYPGRGNKILDINQNDLDSNGVPYLTLNYAIGPNTYRDETGKRIDLTGKVTPLFVNPSNVQADMGTHAGDDVGIFASGPQSHLFTGVMEQNVIPHLMAYASCIGNGPTVCNPDIRCE